MQLQFRRVDPAAASSVWPVPARPARERVIPFLVPTPVGEPPATDERRAIVGKARPQMPAFGDDEALSPREVEILTLLSKGCKQAEIGQLLGISVHTVGSHLKNVYRKLGVHSSLQAVFEARQAGLLQA